MKFNKEKTLDMLVRTAITGTVIGMGVGLANRIAQSNSDDIFGVGWRINELATLGVLYIAPKENLGWKGKILYYASGILFTGAPYTFGYMFTS